MRSSLIGFILKALNKSSRFLYRDFFELEMQQSSKGSKKDFVQKSYNKCKEILTAELERYGDKMTFDIIPIDAIDNFERAIPFFSIVIVGYLKGESTPIVSLVEFPILGETYYAEKGSGMWLEKVQQSSSGNSAIRLRVSSNKDHMMAVSDTNQFNDKSFASRNFGCSSYSACLVASGKADISYVSSSNHQLRALAALFMQESGGKVTSDNPLILSNGYSNMPS